MLTPKRRQATTIAIATRPVVPIAQRAVDAEEVVGRLGPAAGRDRGLEDRLQPLVEQSRLRREADEQPQEDGWDGEQA